MGESYHAPRKRTTGQNTVARDCWGVPVEREVGVGGQPTLPLPPATQYKHVLTPLAQILGLIHERAD